MDHPLLHSVWLVVESSGDGHSRCLCPNVGVSINHHPGHLPRHLLNGLICCPASGNAGHEGMPYITPATLDACNFLGVLPCRLPRPAGHGIAAFDQLVPIAVDLFLGVAADEERESGIELIRRAAIEKDHLLTFELDRDRSNLAYGPLTDPFGTQFIEPARVREDAHILTHALICRQVTEYLNPCHNQFLVWSFLNRMQCGIEVTFSAPC